MSLEARIQTDRPERYLAQICKHAEAMGNGGHRARMHGEGAAGADVTVRADWTDIEGTLTFGPWGTCAITAVGSTLVLRIDADDAEGAGRIREVLTSDLDRFGRRDGLVVDWRDDSGA